jgi:hypothetical protein
VDGLDILMFPCELRAQLISLRRPSYSGSKMLDVRKPTIVVGTTSEADNHNPPNIWRAMCRVT